ncbi:MAG: 2-phospho-L-lactate transferase [Actinobacteria bacterium 21-64-8]|nr:MAG: 2-phospho-L-lactate transferase [Actinobacteria bacterium 21-64-8]
MIVTAPSLSKVICVLSGGVGAARLLQALSGVIEPRELRAVVNVGDDLVLHGLTICPDLDTIAYTLSGRHNDVLGWGLKDESWRVMDELDALGGEAWFRLGDRDLATHLYRSQRLGEGATKTIVTAELCAKFGVDVALLPVSDDPLATVFDTELGTLSFQEYFVRHRHDVVVHGVKVEGAASARVSAGARDALTTAARVVIAPSNPLISIDPILQVGDVRSLVRGRRDDVVAVSPIIAGAAVKGPADRLLGELGYAVSCVGVADFYGDMVGTWIIDEHDAEHADTLRERGHRVIVTTTLMHETANAHRLARAVLS